MSLLALTSGEPSGIGPDIILKAAHRFSKNIMIIGDRTLFQARAELLKLPYPKNLNILHIPLRVSCVPGKLDPRNSEYVLEILETAVTGCLKKNYRGLVTGPVHKGVLNQAGIPFKGHTEWLKQWTNAPHTLMLFVAQELKVALYTTHIPLKEIPATLNRKQLIECIRVLHRNIQNYFSLPNPRIGVFGLNPHAGEGGYMGTEDIEIIKPVIDQLNHQNIKIYGPLSADTAFIPEVRSAYDVYLSMYHDQALPAIKSLAFHELVNVTLGLPFIRTSVDHGTALDLAGTGLAHEGSLVSAIHLAEKLIHHTMS